MQKVVARGCGTTFYCTKFFEGQYMKKLLFVLACAASLGLWISCNNEAQDTNLKIDTAMVEKDYKNHGIVTATKVTMVTHKGVAVTYEDDKPNNMPADGKDWYVATEYDYDKDGKIVSKEYWFYNDWDSGTEVTFDKADISWNGDISYRKTEYYDDGNDDDDDDNYAIVGHENVSNGKEYLLWLDYKGAEVALHRRYRLFASGNAVKLLDNYYNDYQSDNKEIDDHFSTASLALEGSLEGDFTIKGALKALDYCYSEDKRKRLDERYTYTGSWSDNESDDEGGDTSGGVEKPGDDEEFDDDDIKPGDDDDNGQFGSDGDDDIGDKEEDDGDEGLGEENVAGSDEEETSDIMAMSGAARVSVAKLKKTSADTSVYYLKDVKFTKR